MERGPLPGTCTHTVLALVLTRTSTNSVLTITTNNVITEVYITHKYVHVRGPLHIKFHSYTHIMFTCSSFPDTSKLLFTVCILLDFSVVQYAAYSLAVHCPLDTCNIILAYSALHSELVLLQNMEDSTPDLLKNSVYATETTEIPASSQLQTIEVRHSFHSQTEHHNLRNFKMTFGSQEVRL